MPVARRHPLVLFFILAYALAWTLWVPAVVLQESVPALAPISILIGSFAPSVAAILLTGLYEGRGQVKALLKRLLKWRVGFVWYLVVLLGPLIIVLVAAGLYALLGGPAPNLGSLLLLLPTLVYISILGGPLGEEPGWRGYALPRLQASQSALMASLILGILWALWHLPLFLMEGTLHSQIPAVAFLVQVVALAVLFTWVYNNTGGSVLMVLLFHGMWNSAPATVFSQAIRDPRLIWLYAGLVCVVAIAAAVLAGPGHLSREHRKQEEPVIAAASAPRVS